jgi:aldehyde dehydrogenase (NAD+)
MHQALVSLGLSATCPGVFAGGWVARPSGPEIASVNPTTGEPLARVLTASPGDYERALGVARDAFDRWRGVPAPVRGELVRRVGNALRAKKTELATLITLETGKILPEALGEVQEMIDVADFAVGLSRQLYGRCMHSERPAHRMLEQWHPLGVVGVLSAFNFPAAVWAWNALIAAVCGDTVVWKPSEEAPLTAVAITRIVDEVVREAGHPPVFTLVAGGREVGALIASDRRIPLVSATGSTAMGRDVGETVARRLGRSLLELGGNNAIIVLGDADLELVVRAVLFGAVGTAGQRCTTTRRLFVERSVASELTRRLVEAYARVPIGDPSSPETLMGPLIHERAVVAMMGALASAKEQGARILTGGARLDRPGYFVTPALVEAPLRLPIAREETFAPILYVFEVDSVAQAIALQNDVPQGLSSAIFTRDLSASERFLSFEGSDCGIANVNLGTSGAEIGGAFGGEKDTGGGRESGSDSWKAYMRRQTATINFGKELPLAQGIRFGDS